MHHARLKPHGFLREVAKFLGQLGEHGGIAGEILLGEPNAMALGLRLGRGDFPFHDRAAQRKVLYAQLHERLAALPGVKAVGVGKGETRVEKVTLEGRKEPVEVLLEGTGVEQCDPQAGQQQ